MTERQIFEEALKIEDRTQRELWVDQSCAGDAVMRARLVALLHAHESVSEFLNVPVAEQLSPLDPYLTGHAARPRAAADGEPGEDDEDISSGFDLSFLTTSSKPGSIGTLGHYEILQVLGQGAFGIVFKAFDERLHRYVAIKAMNPQLAATSPPRKRFLREARSAAAIKHDNIVQVYSVEEQPLPYLVMEYIDGQTLQQKLDETGPLNVAELLYLGRQMATGLAAAHAQGLIHRDIKPTNVLLERGVEQKVKITDFGLARAADDASLTRTGLISGTPMYMAPEQAMGVPLDHRADLFSMGTVLYQMASGRPPFRAANSMAVLKRVTEETPRPIQEIISEVPDWLCDIITKLHAKDPEDRFQSAKEVADLFDRCQSEFQLTGRVTCVPKGPASIASAKAATHEPVSRPPVPHAFDKALPAAKKPVRLLLVIGCMSLLLVIVTWMRSKPHDATENRASAGPQSADSLQTRNPPQINVGPEVSGGLSPSVAKTGWLGKTGWQGWPADAPAPAIAPFNAEQAKRHQQAWADYLKLPVEYTNSMDMKFVLIPPGEFTMGAAPAESEQALKLTIEDKFLVECFQSEGPQHKVLLTQPIYLGLHEVTQQDFEGIMGWNPSYFSAVGAGKDFVSGIDTTRYPAEMVCWLEAAEFCAKLSVKNMLKPFYSRLADTVTPLEGNGYRLPTEAEWEFGCRAGTTTRYWTGDNDEDLAQAGWVGTNSSDRPHAVGELKANPWGLFDTHGNVWELVQDAWDPAYYGQIQGTPAINPSGPSPAGSRRAIRGGYWSQTAIGCRSAHRYATTPDYRNYSFGFRVALTIEAVQRSLSKLNAQDPQKTTGIRSPAVAPPAGAPFDVAELYSKRSETDVRMPDN